MAGNEMITNDVVKNSLVSIYPQLSTTLYYKDRIPKRVLGDTIEFVKKNNEGRYSNSEYEVWDLVPRNVLKDKDGDIFIIDAEIALK